ncbi:Uncharacterized protein dnm_086430 [Desulfonema magnum]|uniref:Uncharacterized protein n=1 Tax=Desulfonema magnum TaxID=45655 RepID=A0A975BWR2_9BACT|nr:Uncharacterized protein dnm_086430 [Desulfonema magnum]
MIIILFCFFQTSFISILFPQLVFFQIKKATKDSLVFQKRKPSWLIVRPYC